MIKELDIVALTRDLPEQKLATGDTGTVVMTHEGGKGYTVEFMTFSGDTIGVVTLRSSDIRQLDPREIPNARKVA